MTGFKLSDYHAQRIMPPIPLPVRRVSKPVVARDRLEVEERLKATRELVDRITRQVRLDNVDTNSVADMAKWVGNEQR